MQQPGNKTWRKLLLLAVVLALIAAACSGDDDTTDTTAGDDTTETTEEQPTETTEGSTETTEASGGEGEELVLQAVMSEEATDLHPLTTGQQGKGHVFQAIFMPLLETNNEKEIYSRTLESWEMSADAQTATLVLRDDVEWNDGTPMTADDVYLSLTLYLDNNISNRAERIGGVLGQEAYVAGETDTIEGLTIVDERTVTVDLENPDAAWLPNIAAQAEDLPILPNHVLADVPTEEILDHEYFRTYPVSSGPYQLVEFVDGQYAEFVRNDNWSLGTPGFDRVFFRIVSTDVMAAQLETGEIQVMFPVDPADVDRISGIEGITVGSEQGIAPELWSIMFDDEELDVRVRQAMLFAIDRESICQEAMSGYCSTPTTNIRQIAPEWSIPTVEEYPDLIEYTYDPDRARELLAEAEADGAWDPDTELIFNARPGRSYVDTAIAIAQAQMAEVGINWTIINTDTGGLIDNIREQPLGTIDGFWVSGADFTVDPSAVQVYTSCDTARTGANLISYCRPELDALWEAGRQTSVQEERAEIYHEAFRFLNQDPAEIYLYIVDSIIAYDSRIQGIKPHGGIGQPYWNIGEWTWEE
jgi:peptide/nickel transport system substrate-binding protein